MITDCLTFEQLQAYSAHTVKKAERERLYMHIASCELCAAAVNGFAAIPFASDELVAIHRKIDARTNAAAANPLTFARLLIMLASVCAIAGVYWIAAQPYADTTLIPIHPAAPAALIIQKNETQSPSEEEISYTAAPLKKIVNVTRYKKFERSITPVEQLEAIQPVSASAKGIAAQTMNNDAADDVVAPHYDANVIYIYDLKVSDYNKLYFDFSKQDLFASHTNTAASRENRNSAADEFGPEEHRMPADRILKEGLAAFNRQDFGKAIADFSLLTGNNPDDVNAHFYAALSYYNINKVNKAIDELNAVLKNSNEAFRPEAQWYLALVMLKTSDKEKAKGMLETIAGEKGFYAKKAKEKLKSLE